MRTRALLIRVIMLSAVTLLTTGAVHSEPLSSRLPELRRERPGSLPAQLQVLTGLHVDWRSIDGAATAATASPSGRAWAPRGEPPASESAPVFEPDLWTMLAGSMGLVFFLAMRRL